MTGSKKKILILNESFRINETSSGIVNSKFICTLGKEYELDILYEEISYQVTWINKKNIQLYPIQFENRQKKVIEHIPKIRAIPTLIRGQDAYNRKKIKIWTELIRKKLNNSHYDLIIALGSGMSFLPHWALLNVDTKIPILMYFHDPYPLCWYPEPYARTNFLFDFQKKRATRKMIKNARFAGFPSLELKNHMAKFIPQINDKYIILPHLGMDLSNLPSTLMDKSISFEPGKFNILHAGTLLGPRKTDALFSAFHRLLNEDKEFEAKAHLTVLGKVAREHKNIGKNIESHKDNYTIFTERVSYKKSIQLLKQSDLALIIEAAADFSPFMPGKMADILFYQRPLLALTPKVSEVRRILGEDYPFMAEADDEEGIYRALKLAWENWKKGQLVLPKAEELKHYVSEERFLKEFNKILFK